MPARCVAAGCCVAVRSCGESRRADRDPTVSVELGAAHGCTYGEYVARAERREADHQRREARR